MRATFGISSCINASPFMLMVSLDILESYYPQLYGNVEAPFVLPPIQLNGGTGTNKNYVGNLVMSMATQGVAVTPRDVLGTNPKVVVSYSDGSVSQRVVEWSSSNRLLWRVDSQSTTPSVVKIMSILDSKGIVRWRNPSDN